MDNGRYPTTEQGLRALVQKPSGEPEPRNYRPEGYLQGGAVPLDPWGEPYQYGSPGQHNTYSPSTSGASAPTASPAARTSTPTSATGPSEGGN